MRERERERGRGRHYLEGKLAIDVVLWSNGTDNITGQWNTAQHRLLSAVWEKMSDIEGTEQKEGRSFRERKRERENV